MNQNEVSVRWTGYFTPSTPGEHLVFVHGAGEEGGFRLYLDDKLVIDNWELRQGARRRDSRAARGGRRTRFASSISLITPGADR